MKQGTETAAVQGEEPMGTTWSFGTSWSMTGMPARLLALVLALVVGAALAAPAAHQDAATALTDRAVANAQELVDVIVRQVVGSHEAERSVERLGGTVDQRLDVVDGFVARVPAGEIDSLTDAPGVLSVTADARVRLFSKRAEGDAIVGSTPLSFVRKITGSTVSDRKSYDGTGIGVALVDTGVADVAGLPRVVRGPSVGSGTSLDGWGHGTHLAGIISGNDYSTATDSLQGVANESLLVSVKAANDDGTTDLTTVLSALDWVAQNKDSKNIRVLNLALGVTPLGDYRYDVLAIAVERLWQLGVVVVVAAGNDGEMAGSPITSPGYDPYVIAVGSVDPKNTETTSDDVVQPFSPRGSAARRVDIVAPGQSVVSLRAPGSNAESFPDAFVGTRFIKGTGTSQAAAVVSALAADLIEQRPSLTPDQVKWLLKAGATPLNNTDEAGQGAGLVNLKKALATNTPSNATQSWPAAGVAPSASPSPSSPPPPADAEYCDYDPTLGPPSPTTTSCGWSGGQWSADGATFSGGTWTGGTWTGGTWTGGTWTGGTWTGGTWTGGTWTGGTWTGGTWTGGTWTGGTWTGGTWTGGTWTGGTWTGGTWTGGTWTGGTWTGGTWTGGTWTGGTWTGGTWTGGTWTGGTWTGGTWTGGTWTGGTWTGGTWTGGTWTGGTWTGGTWTGGTWTGGTWTGGTWTGGTWTGGTWTGGTWTGGTWTGGTWTGGSWTGAAWTGTTWS